MTSQIDANMSHESECPLTAGSNDNTYSAQNNADSRDIKDPDLLEIQDKFPFLFGEQTRDFKLQDPGKRIPHKWEYPNWLAGSLQIQKSTSSE